MRAPLAGKRIVVSRAADQAAPLTTALEARGAMVVLAPAIRIEPPEDIEALDEALGELEGFDWMILTSQNAVDAVFDRLERSGLGLPDRLSVAAVGPKTEARLRARGGSADVVPERHLAEAIFDALSARTSLWGKRCLLPRGDRAGDDLRQRLLSAGADARAVTVYRTVSSGAAVEEALARVEAGEIDVVTFTSASTVHGFLGDRDPERLAGRFEPASIGPVTTEALSELGYPVSIEATPSTLEGLVEAIAAFYEEGG